MSDFHCELQCLVRHCKDADPDAWLHTRSPGSTDLATKNNKFVWWGIVRLQTPGVGCRPKRVGLQTCAP